MQSATRLALCAFSFVIIVHNLTTCGHCQTNSAAKLYFFTNPSCGPCRKVEPELEQLHREGYSIMKIDTFAHPDWTRRFQVTRTPTVVLVAGGKVVGRRTGFVDAATLRDWFRNVERPPQNLTVNAAPNPEVAADVVQAGNSRPEVAPVLPKTSHVGTSRPANEVERLALQATVRLKVDDPRGSSYATGTVVHYRAGEALVLTCGHVFRDSQGTGTISAEYGFADGHISSTRGELLFYDADERDIGLVVISTEHDIQPVSVAIESYPIHRGDQIFSIGCDHGQDPTIRRSRVKNQARYDGVVKYEIFGRPVDGRSGGGMFTAGGQLIGVCNAAVVDADEGVYVALDTIHWQFRQANLAHLFNRNASLASRQSELPDQRSLAGVVPRPPAAALQMTSVPVRDRVTDPFPPVTGNQINGSNVVRANVQANRGKSELIVVLRSSDASGASQSWTVENPSQELIQQLQQLGQAPQPPAAVNQMARLRQTMPDVQQGAQTGYPNSQMRAQSPR